jgi:hypothetical protein
MKNWCNAPSLLVRGLSNTNGDRHPEMVIRFRTEALTTMRAAPEGRRLEYPSEREARPGRFAIGDGLLVVALSILPNVKSSTDVPKALSNRVNFSDRLLHKEEGSSVLVVG